MLQEFRDKIPERLNTKVFTPKFLPEAFNAEGSSTIRAARTSRSGNCSA
jgi:hypothetical protein